MAVAATRPAADAGRMSLRTIGGIVFCALVGAWIARAIFVWILDVPDVWEGIAIGAFALVGAIVGVAAEAERAPDRRMR